jgi:hypothetical protein
MLFLILSFLMRIVMIIYLYSVTLLRNVVNLDGYERMAVVDIRNS